MGSNWVNWKSDGCVKPSVSSKLQRSWTLDKTPHGAYLPSHTAHPSFNAAAAAAAQSSQIQFLFSTRNSLVQWPIRTAWDMGLVVMLESGSCLLSYSVLTWYLSAITAWSSELASKVLNKNLTFVYLSNGL